MEKLITIGEAAQRTGLSAKMIRHYEASGLLKCSKRSEAGYRLYDSQQLQLLGVIKQARKLGFPIAQIQSLLDLLQNPDRTSREVKSIAEHHLNEIEHKINELQQMRETLKQLSDNCSGDENANCPILDGLCQNSLK
ncbi:Cu(I)-responsive transcriptional regulator [Pseudoalteromonas piscicida]|uniref:Cu(I)-responsive transcriptional regulator n=1 Tax=Pseudoalteromonas piscicida TaxID=43662 RepID=UPI000E35E2B3|nr:Cu(I)-responsive transcriptional regulator [Pseudoalteromonas piscicida]AXR00307.1 Cu(I)-responsive transcriptional regulator [Pseudoalteromonas piscicida]